MRCKTLQQTMTWHPQALGRNLEHDDNQSEKFVPCESHTIRVMFSQLASNTLSVGIVKSKDEYWKGRWLMPDVLNQLLILTVGSIKWLVVLISTCQLESMYNSPAHPSFCWARDERFHKSLSPPHTKDCDGNYRFHTMPERYVQRDPKSHNQT